MPLTILSYKAIL